MERGKPSSYVNLRECLLSGDHRREWERTKTETEKGQVNRLPLESKEDTVSRRVWTVVSTAFKKSFFFLIAS